jgi:hypothetical protein
MTSGSLHAPVATRRGPAVGGPQQGTVRPVVVVTGTPRAGKSSVVDALLGPLVPAPRGGLREAAPGAGPQPAAGWPDAPAAAFTGPSVAAGAPTAEAFVVFRHGTAVSVAAFAPGRREPLPLGEGDAVAPRGALRPPRRVEITRPAPVLNAVTLVDTPSGGLREPAYAEIVLDAAAGGRLLFAADAAAALTLAQLDFLAEADQRRVPVTFVLTKIDEHPHWPAVLAANQRLVHDHAPSLAAARWFAVNVHAEDTADAAVDPAVPPALDEAARGLAGLGMAALRRALVADAADELAEPALGAPVPAPLAVTATSDERWRALLDREARTRRLGTAQRLSVDLATAHTRCVRELASGGCPALPHAFDRELHAVSLRATRLLDAAATALVRRVFTAVLDAEPGPAALARIGVAVRRAAEQAGDPDREWDRVLLLTATAGVAVTSGAGVLTGLGAVGERARPAVLPPLAVALSAGCYHLWQDKPNADRKRCRAWLQQALVAVERELDRELTERFTVLAAAVAAVATDTVDHGVLLA